TARVLWNRLPRYCPRQARVCAMSCRPLPRGHGRTLACQPSALVAARLVGVLRCRVIIIDGGIFIANGHRGIAAEILAGSAAHACVRDFLVAEILAENAVAAGRTGARRGLLASFIVV